MCYLQIDLKLDLPKNLSLKLYIRPKITFGGILTYHGQIFWNKNSEPSLRSVPVLYTCILADNLYYNIIYGKCIQAFSIFYSRRTYSEFEDKCYNLFNKARKPRIASVMQTWVNRALFPKIINIGGHEDKSKSEADWRQNVKGKVWLTAAYEWWNLHRQVNLSESTHG